MISIISEQYLLTKKYKIKLKMAQERKVLNRVIDDPDEEIVISGISGRFPNSDNMFEFEHHLYNKVRFPVKCLIN